MLDEIKKEDLPESFWDIVDVIGMDVFRNLVRLIGGSNLYIPNEGSLVRSFRNKVIRDNFEGDYMVFARRFGISEAMVRIIVSGK
ncbi:MAG: Mor transcription activator family protein [Peptostreptococcaceae bacterium]